MSRAYHSTMSANDHSKTVRNLGTKTKRMKEEVELDEVTQSAIKKPVTQTGPDGKTRTVMKSIKNTEYDDHGQEKIKTKKESVTKKSIQRALQNVKAQPKDKVSVKKAPWEKNESLEEAVKAGNMKLRDGSSVKVSAQDAKLITQMMKDLNAANRRKMEKVMMTDKAGFEEILGFAREAL